MDEPEFNDYDNWSLSIAYGDLHSLRAEILRLLESLKGLADISHRRQVRLQIERLQGHLLTRLEEAEHARLALQRESEQWKREAEKQCAIVQVLAENTPQVAIIVVDAPSGKVTYTNTHWRRTVKEPLPQADNPSHYHPYGGLAPADRPYASEDPVARAILENKIIEVKGMPYRRADSEERLFEIRAIPVHNREGGMIAAVGIAFDVTEE